MENTQISEIMRKKMVKLPVIFLDTDNEVDEKCESLIKDAARMGISPEKYCPECFEEDVTYDSYEYVDVDDIKSFNPLDEKRTRVVFYSGDKVAYELPIADFLNITGKFVDFN